MASHRVNPLANIIFATMGAWSMARNYGYSPAFIRPVLPGSEEAKKLFDSLSEADQSIFLQTLDQVILTRTHRLNQGVEVYHSHPYRRQRPLGKCIWQQGTTSLQDYGSYSPNKRTNSPIALFIPSLINRSYIFDLKETVSLAGFLGQQNFHPMLIDWGDPGEEELTFTVEDYILKRLLPALQKLRDTTNQPIVLIGYCMGGVMAVALAAIAQARGINLKGLVTLAAPWDFSVQPLLPRLMLENLLANLNYMPSSETGIPGEMLQVFFHHLYFQAVLKKYLAFSDSSLSAEKLEHFVAVEDWINDEVNVSRPLAVSCIQQWYLENQPFTGNWVLDGITVVPQQLTLPSLVVAPARDQVIPTMSSIALAQQLSNAQVLTPSLGHVGLMVGSRASDLMWHPLCKWLEAI